jgi:hypothetical protein
MRTAEGVGFMGERLDMLSLGCLLDIPVEILNKHENSNVEFNVR